MEHVLQDARDTELIQRILWIVGYMLLCCVSSLEQAPEGRAPPGWSGLPVQADACAGEPSRRARSRHLDWRYSTPCTVHKNQLKVKSSLPAIRLHFRGIFAFASS